MIKIINKQLLFILCNIGFIINATAQLLGESNLTDAYESFYLSLAKGDTTSIKSYIIRHNSIELDGAQVVGDALFRASDGPISVIMKNDIVNKELIAEPFKLMTGRELSGYWLLIVRYPYPRTLREALASKNIKPSSGFGVFETVHMDLWMLASDGKWHVALDYNNGYGPHNQSLGLIVTDDKEFAKHIMDTALGTHQGWQNTLLQSDK